MVRVKLGGLKFLNNEGFIAASYPDLTFYIQIKSDTRSLLADRYKVFNFATLDLHSLQRHLSAILSTIVFTKVPR